MTISRVSRQLERMLQAQSKTQQERQRTNILNEIEDLCPIPPVLQIKSTNPTQDEHLLEGTQPRLRVESLRLAHLHCTQNISQS